MTSLPLNERKKESYQIFDQIAGTYDFLNRLLSCGIDIYWRNKFLKYLPQTKSINALDLATGTADVPLTLIKDESVTKITGLDLSEEMMIIGRKKISKAGLDDKIQLMQGDGVQIPCADDTFDLVTISFGIRNFSDPQKSLEDIYRVLKPNGRLMIMELSLPKSKIVRALYFFYFRKILPLVGNLLSKHSDAYTYLNQTVEDFPYGDKFAAMMTKAGFSSVKYHEQTFGIATLYIGDRK